MLRQLLAIAGNTFLESVRQPIYFILILAGCFAQVANLLLSAYSMGYTEDLEVDGDDKLLLEVGLATVMVIGVLLASFIATNVLSREIERKTVLTVIAKPVSRPAFVLGKYLGVAGAMLVAVVTLLMFFFLAIRHEVMSTARDSVDIAVVVGGGGALLLSLGIGIWGNYFYGWVFSSTATLILAPLSLLAWVFTLAVSQDLQLQSLGTDFKPQIAIAAAAVALSMLVLTAIALACSTRLGQVMTIVITAGIFVLGLLSNALLGRFAFQNDRIAVIQEVRTLFEDDTLDQPGDELTIVLETQPDADLLPGAPMYYGPAPSGVALAVPAQKAFTGDLNNTTDVRNPDLGRGLVVRAYEPEGRELTLVNVGGLSVSRLPREGDYLFTQPTENNLIALSMWAIVPNLQAFWLVDAVTQGHDITPRYVVLLVGYSGTQIIALLSLAIFLFERRDVG